jgi:hypothetical protein
MTPRIKERVGIAGLIAFSFALAVSAGASSGAEYKNLLGTWDAQTDDGAFTFVFEFSAEGDRLVGKYTGASGSVPMSDLAFKDGALSFSVDLGGMVIQFSASVVEAHLAGTLTLQYGEAGFTGTKRKDRAAS